MSREKLVRMANQIATYFESQPDDPAKGVADHINAFWDPRMRAQLLDLAKVSDAGLSPAVERALPDIHLPDDVPAAR